MNEGNTHNEMNSASNLNKKSKPGRAARRRKAKERSIHEALDQLLSGNQSSLTSSHDNTLPTDRSESLAGVMELREKLNVKIEDDERRVVSQLGFFPGNAITIPSRVADLKDTYPHLHSLLLKQNIKQDNAKPDEQDQYPTTLQLYPLAIRNVHMGGKQGRKFKSRKRGHDGNSVVTSSSEQTTREDERHTLEHSTILEPFPTMYWLTHPILRVLISRIELGNSDNVMEMERRLSSSQSHLVQMQRAHESYGRSRWSLLTEDDMKYVEQRKWNDAIGTCKGVAGIKRYQTIKCLHTHAAHYLATMNNANKNDENIVGRWVLEVVEREVQNMKDDE